MPPSTVSVHAIKPAEYNPRKIAEDDFEKLCASLKRLGVIVPIIVNPKNSVIVAGHQRQKACKAIGLGEIPCYYAENVSLSDEVIFNQLHNSSDFDQGLTSRVMPQDAEGWVEIQPADNLSSCDRKAIVSEICKLIQRYGNVLSCVVTKSGEVFKAPAYATACKVLGIPCNAYVVPEADEQYAKAAFKSNYGVFSYDHLEKHTWVQGTAQMNRKITAGKSGRTLKSRLYEQLVIPNITKEMRILDFGAGKCTYAKMLNGKGYHIDTLEFYHNNGRAISVNATLKEADTVFRHLEEHGLYDAVVCDSVLNSVDSLEAERSVVATCNAMLKEGGLLFISGRTMESAVKRMNLKTVGRAERYMEFLDADGFSGRFRRGNFYYQKFHTDEQVRNLIAEHGFALLDSKGDQMAWRVSLRKQDDSPNWEDGVRFEFSLPHPGGRYELADRAIEAVGSARLRSASGRTASSCK